MPYTNVYFNGLPKGNFFLYRKHTAKTTSNFQFLTVFIALLILLTSNFLQAQTGYIYVHLKSINEENSTDFSFTLKNSLGVTTNTFSLNDQATADNVAVSGNNLHVYDMGLSHGTNGDGQLWAVAGTSFGALIAFNPYSDGIFDYSFIDANPVSGINYYRIAEVGYDNESNYSDIRAVDLPTAFKISIWPNPATDVLHVQYNGSLNNMSAVIIDELGRSIIKSAIYLGKNTISLSNMHSGIYFMLVVGANKEVLCKKIIEKGK